MFTKKLSKLLINCKNLTSLYRLDPALTCAPYTKSINHFQQSSCKHLCTSSIEYENLVNSNTNEEYEPYLIARKVLTNREIYSKALASSLKLRDDIKIDDINQFLMKSWISMSTAELLENFEVLSNFAERNKENLMNLQFDGILEVIKNRCADFSDDELLHLLKCLKLWIFDRKDEKFLKFWKYIDNECLNRFRKWSIDKILLFNDHFYRLKLSRGSDFTYHSLKKVAYKPEKYSLVNLIHFAFLTNVNRRMFINLYNHEHHIEKYVDKLSLEELAIFASAISYYGSSIRSTEFLRKIAVRLTNEINDVSDFALSKLLRVLRKTYDKELKNDVRSLLEVLETQISTRNLKLIGFFADLQQRTLIHNPNLTKKILDRLEKELKKASLKLLDTVTNLLSTFNYQPKDCKFYSLVIDELLSPDRATEINTYPHLFSNVVFSLSLVSFYSEEAIKIILDPQFIQKVAKGDYYRLSHAYLFIDYFVEFEHPEYNGPRIQKDILAILMKRFGSLHMEKLNKKTNNKRMKIVEDVAAICKKTFNSESAVVVDALLPQFARNDVVLCKDPNGNIISPEDKLSQMPAGSIKYAPKDGNKWYALAPALFENNLNVIGLKYLQQIGYTPIQILFDEWKNLIGEDEKQKYIKEILSR